MATHVRFSGNLRMRGCFGAGHAADGAGQEEQRKVQRVPVSGGPDHQSGRIWRLRALCREGDA
jgi:hypothetical protein